MKILAIADQLDPLVYSLNIKNRFQDIDVVLSAGDLDITYYEYIISCLNKPLFFVFGNHNLKKMGAFLPHSKNFLSQYTTFSQFASICLEKKVTRSLGPPFLIAGLGGSFCYNNGIHQFTELRMFLRILSIVPKMIFYRIFQGRFLDILLTHAPPKGIHDRPDPCHQGFKVFLWFMKIFKPKYLIHGHVHIYDINASRKTIFQKTTVVNAYKHIVLEMETTMKENSHIKARSDQNFSQARQRAWVQSLRHIVNPESRQLLSFHDIKNLVKPKGEIYGGMKTVALENIVGSEDRYQDFNQHFLPKREHMRPRWTNIDSAYQRDIALPPIVLLKIDELYFVRDGNHRVSVARSQGMQAIDAEVVELSTAIPVAKKATRENILAAVLVYERRSVLEETGIDRIIPVEDIGFTSPGSWYQILHHIQGHKYFLNMDRHEEMSLEEAIRSWHKILYLPIVEIIRKEELLLRFPRRSEADLYIWIIEYWHNLKEQYGQEYPLGKAANEYATTHGKSPCLRLIQSLKKIFKKS